MKQYLAKENLIDHCEFFSNAEVTLERLKILVTEAMNI